MPPPIIEAVTRIAGISTGETSVRPSVASVVTGVWMRGTRQRMAMSESTEVAATSQNVARHPAV